MHVRASFYCASQTLHFYRSEAKIPTHFIAMLTLLQRSVRNQTRGVSKAAGMNLRNHHAQSHPTRSPCAPLDSRPHPRRWSWTPLISSPFPLFCLLQKVMHTGPCSSDLRDGSPSLRSAFAIRRCWVCQLFTPFITEKCSIVWVCRFVHAIAPEAHCVGSGPGVYEWSCYRHSCTGYSVDAYIVLQIQKSYRICQYNLELILVS